ncbi:MAG: porin [Pseudomonadota bacterium]
MVGGFKNTSSRLAIATAATVFAGGLALTPAQAADLGGDCCADLEERVAELEATAVRHGNRKVKLTLSGQVNSALLYFDDGIDSDVYVIDNDESSTRIRLDAVGTIRPGLTAGLVIEFDVEIAGGSRIGGFDGDEGVQRPDDDGDGIQLRRANWFVKGDFGKISIGQGSMASDGAYEVSFSNAWYGSVGYGLGVTNIGPFVVRNHTADAQAIDPNAGNVTWYAVGTDNDTSRRNRVRYDSPTFGGFTASASWGEDDEYDVALRFAREFNGLKVAAAAAYHVDEDDNGPNGTDATDIDRFGISAAMLHTPSGFHLQGGYSTLTIENGAGSNAAGDIFQRDHYWIAAGVQFRASSLGTTDFTVDYIHNDNEFLSNGNTVVEYDSIGIGMSQDIDAVGGTLYLSYRYHEAETVSGDGTLFTTGTSDEFDQITFGMRLKY